MKIKVDYNELKEKLLKYWFIEHKGLGIKRYQFNNFGNKNQINRCLRELRKDKQISWGGGGYWIMKEKTFRKIKQ